MEKLEKVHQELGSVEKLFDLPVRVYPDLIKAQNDLKGLKQIYEIYELQRVSIALRVHRHTRIRAHTPRKGVGGEEEDALSSSYCQLCSKPVHEISCDLELTVTVQ